MNTANGGGVLRGVLREKEVRSRGSIAVEAALILPIFLIGFVSLLSINLMMTNYQKIQAAMFEVVYTNSLNCYDGSSINPDSVRAELMNCLEDFNVNKTIVRGGFNGINISESRMGNPEYILLRVSYDFLPIGADFFNLGGVPVTQQCCMHSWCGYIDGYLSAYNQQYVYITENSEVYHRNRECSHIKLEIRSISSDELKNARNNSGAKYYPCEFCHSRSSDQSLYITPEGNKYHNCISCSGLRRKVWAIKITEAGNRRPCMRCGR